MDAITLSLRSSDPLEVKARTARLDEYLEQVWSRLPDDKPTVLTHKQAVALGGEFYRAWAAGEGRERTISVTIDRQTREPILDPESGSAGNVPEYWSASRQSLENLKQIDEDYREKVALGRLDPTHEKRPYEKAFGPIVDPLLSRRAITQLDHASREMVLEAFRQALLDAFAARERNASGDYSPDPKAARFPPLEESFESETAKLAPKISTSWTQAKVSLKGLFEDWWKEAEAAGRTESTRDSYSRTFRLFGEFIGHDVANRISPDDIQRFKDHRREQSASIKTVRDSDISALKSVFGWAVGNGRLKSNPAANVKMMAVMVAKVRKRAFTEDEVRAILRHASDYRPNSSRETPKVAAAKRWVPWLRAYSSARAGVELNRGRISRSRPAYGIQSRAPQRWVAAHHDCRCNWATPLARYRNFPTPEGRTILSRATAMASAQATDFKSTQRTGS